MSRFKQNSCHCADNIFKCIILKENVCILIKIPLKFIHKDLIDDKSSLVQVMAWHLTGAKPLPESVMTQFTNEYMHHWDIVNTNFTHSTQGKF